LTMFMLPDITLKHRLISLLLLPMIFLSNIMRIVLGILLGIHTNMHLMVLFHDTLGQVFVLISMVAMLLIFLNVFGYTKLKRRS
jgi:exosortase/archaeosortase family protein